MKAPITVTTRMWSRRNREEMIRTISYQPCEIDGCNALGCYGFPFGCYCTEHREIGEDRYAANSMYRQPGAHL